jgi:CYTH domain-containing protein
MPVECERKIILKDLPNAQRVLSELRLQHQSIDQHYMDDNARVRRIMLKAPGGASMGISYTFTYKRMIQGRLLELPPNETISADDYYLAVAASVKALIKTRYALPRRGHTWEVDFLYNSKFDIGGPLYFGLAECEFEEGKMPGDEMIPEDLLPFVDLIVPIEHNYLFTNARLTDVEYARTAVERYRAGTLS